MTRVARGLVLTLAVGAGAVVAATVTGVALAPDLAPALAGAAVVLAGAVVPAVAGVATPPALAVVPVLVGAAVPADVASVAFVPALAVVAGAVMLRALSGLRWRRPVSVTARSTRRRPPGWVAEVAAAADLAAGRVYAAWVTALAVAPVVAVAAGPALGMALAAAVLAAPAVLPGVVRRRADARLDAALPGALDTVARSLRGGAALRQALADASADTPGRLGDDLRAVVDRTSAGLPLREALEEWGRVRPRPGVLLAVAALGLAVETGGASARAVDGVATTLRRRLSLQDEAAALSAQARTSAAVLAAAPLVVCALTLVGGGGAAAFLLRSPLGVACLVVGLALDGVGGWWMVRLTRAPAAAPAFLAPPPRTCVRIASPSTSIRTQVREALP